MNVARGKPMKWTVGVASACLVALLPAAAFAGTWTNGRPRPHLGHIVAIDATGEPSWPFGQEDVAGDGLGAFTAQEQSIDVRTAYAATDEQRLWVRVYLSSVTAPDPKATVFVFVDADRSPQTGGSGAATDISPSFTTDPSVGGYEYVIGIGGAGAIADVWEWRAPQSKFVPLALNPQNVAAEAGRDLDPIAINGLARAYVQASVRLEDVSLTRACTANVYVRSTSETTGLGFGDLDIGRFNECIPSDSDGDKVPDILRPPTCISDAQCPGFGTCTNGACFITRPCSVASECTSGQQCSADGACFAAAGGDCTVSAECGGLVCAGERCVACTSAGATCPSGSQCGADGRCSGSGAGGGSSGGLGGDGGIGLSPGENVEGGAFNCAVSSPGPATCAFGGAAFVGIGLIFARRRRFRSSRLHQR